MKKEGNTRKLSSPRGSQRITNYQNELLGVEGVEQKSG